eukprot:91371-Amphidinium_carterae.1
MQAVARAGLQPWELEKVSNPPIDPSNPPPLIAPDTQPPAPLLQSFGKRFPHRMGKANKILVIYLPKGAGKLLFVPSCYLLGYAVVYVH